MKNALPAAARTAILVLATAVILGSSCSRQLGWGVVVWPPDESAIGYGAVVPVYFMSTITRTYAVGVPGTKDKEELELWRVEQFRSRTDARERAEAFAPMAPMFAVSARDGLLIREEANNRAGQVYRLRVDQVIKLLEKVEGEAVMTGDQRLPGDWYLVMADDGSRGYVFSNQLMPWDASADPKPEVSATAPALDARVSDLYDKIWRPDYFKTMETTGPVDLYRYGLRFGVFASAKDLMVRVERPGYSGVYRYQRVIGRDDGTFELSPTGASFHFTKNGDLVITVPEAEVTPAMRNAAGDGPVAFTFCLQEKDPQVVVAAEERRRLAVLAAMVADGERFLSVEYGSLEMTRSARFAWAGRPELAGVAAEAGDAGAVLMDLFLPPSMTTEWHGGLTLRFDGGERPYASFLYRYDTENLELGYLPPGSVDAAVPTRGPVEPTFRFVRER